MRPCCKCTVWSADQALHLPSLTHPSCISCQHMDSFAPLASFAALLTLHSSDILSLPSLEGCPSSLTRLNSCDCYTVSDATSLIACWELALLDCWGTWLIGTSRGGGQQLRLRNVLKRFIALCLARRAARMSRPWNAHVCANTYLSASVWRVIEHGYLFFSFFTSSLNTVSCLA